VSAGDSQEIVFSVRPASLESQYYDAAVQIVSRFGYGQTQFLKRFSFWRMTGVADQDGVPKEFRLEQNYPNPFNPKTVVSCQLPVASVVRIVVYDVLGREVTVLANDRYPVGKYTFTFDGANLASGVYFCRMTAGSFMQTRAMILTR
jgi:hypothetical protein